MSMNFIKLRFESQMQLLRERSGYIALKTGYPKWQKENSYFSNRYIESIGHRRSSELPIPQMHLILLLPSIARIT